MNLRKLGKNLLEKYPVLIKYANPIYNFLIGFNKRNIKGANNKVIGNSFLKKCNIKIIGNNNFIDLGNLCFLNNCNFYIQGDNNRITLGEKCFLIGAEFWMEDDGNSIKIGSKTSIHGFTHMAATEGKNITIGFDCMFAPDITIRTGDSHSILRENSKYVINNGEDVVVSNHVWIGNKTILLKGTFVGENSIVGSGSVVTKKHEENNIVIAGNPARIVKREIDWVRERIK